MKDNDKKLKVLVVILLFVTIILGGYIVYDKTMKDANVDVVDKDNIKKEDMDFSYSVTDFMELISGQYSDSDASKVASGDGFGNLTLNKDGTYSYAYGMKDGDSYKAAGKYAIGYSELYLFNDSCTQLSLLEDECVYSNCKNIITLNYEIINGELKINDIMQLGTKVIDADYTMIDIINNISSEYFYGSKENGKEGTDYGNLILNKDGTYSYIYGMINGGGYEAAGKYAFGYDKMYLINDKCIAMFDGNECTYANCQKILDYSYELNNNDLSLTFGSIYFEKK